MPSRQPYRRPTEVVTRRLSPVFPLIPFQPTLIAEQVSLICWFWKRFPQGEKRHAAQTSDRS